MNRLLMFCYFVFIVGQILSLALCGSWLGDSEVSIVQQLTGYSVIELESAGGWAIPKQLAGFFVTGIPSMLSWNYPFLNDGFGAIFKWVFLYPISIGVVWGMVEVFAPVIQSIFTGIRNLLPF